MNAHPKFLLQKVLEDDSRFLMGHVLVGASQYLFPMDHKDSLGIIQIVEVAKSLTEEGLHSIVTLVFDTSSFTRM